MLNHNLEFLVSDKKLRDITNKIPVTKELIKKEGLHLYEKAPISLLGVLANKKL